MSRPPDSIDPLEAKATQGTAAAQAAIKREIENILSSYVGWFDPFAELIQNSLDSLDERKKNEGEEYKPALRILIGLKKRQTSLTVSDNGTGLSEEKYRQFLAPSFSFKSGKTRGHKGVGATFLAYGFNFMQIATKTEDYAHVGKMEKARAWLADANPASNPLIVKDKAGCADPEFQRFDRGVSITLRFDPSTVPGDLNWLKADTAKVWKDLLLLKTGLGAILAPLDINVHLKVTTDENTETTENWSTSGRIALESFESAIDLFYQECLAREIQATRFFVHRYLHSLQKTLSTEIHCLTVAFKLLDKETPSEELLKEVSRLLKTYVQPSLKISLQECILTTFGDYLDSCHWWRISNEANDIKLQLQENKEDISSTLLIRVAWSKSHNEIHIPNIMVPDSMRHKGIGKKLIGELHEVAKSYGYTLFLVMMTSGFFNRMKKRGARVISDEDCVQITDTTDLSSRY